MHDGLSNDTGRLTEMKATLDWSAEDPAASALTATVRTDSVDTD